MVYTKIFQCDKGWWLDQFCINWKETNVSRNIVTNVVQCKTYYNQIKKIIDASKMIDTSRK